MVSCVVIIFSGLLDCHKVDLFSLNLLFCSFWAGWTEQHLSYLLRFSLAKNLYFRGSLQWYLGNIIHFICIKSKLDNIFPSPRLKNGLIVVSVQSSSRQWIWLWYPPPPILHWRLSDAQKEPPSVFQTFVRSQHGQHAGWWASLRSLENDWIIWDLLLRILHCASLNNGAVFLQKSSFFQDAFLFFFLISKSCQIFC